jgi:hypothetical protein
MLKLHYSVGRGGVFLFFLAIPVQGRKAFCLTGQQANGEGPVSNI